MFLKIVHFHLQEERRKKEAEALQSASGAEGVAAVCFATTVFLAFLASL